MAATPRGVVRRNGLPPSCHYVFAASRKISHEPSPCEIDDGGALGLGPGRPRARPPRRLAGSRTRQRPRRASDQASSSDLVPMPRNGEQSPVGAQIGIPGCPAQDPVRADLKPRSVRERGGTYRRRRLQPAKERQAKPNDSARSTGPAGAAPTHQSPGSCRPMVHDSVHAGLRPVILVTRPLPAGAVLGSTRFRVRTVAKPRHKPYLRASDGSFSIPKTRETAPRYLAVCPKRLIF
jgi:hypothetical protein